MTQSSRARADAAAEVNHSGPLGWWRDASGQAHRSLIAAWSGWMLDAMDIMLYSLVLNDIRAEFQIDDRMSGLLLALPLASSAVGGVLFGWLADQIGRKRALMASIATYSVFTAACGLSQGPLQLAIFRVMLGIGMGGEWATGAALVAETWPTPHRGKALSVMQTGWSVGYAVAAAVVAIVLPIWGWRAVFFVGLLPALLTLWIRTSVAESELWLSQRARPRQRSSSFRQLFQGSMGKTTWIVTFMNAAAMFAWWGLFTWIPSYLGRPIAAGGAGLSILSTASWIVLMQVGMFLGVLSFGFIADAVGRKKTYVAYLLAAAALVPAYGATRDPVVLLALGPFIAFFGTGYFAGFGAVTAELFPTRIRATAQGFTYNMGRGVSAIAPYAVGTLAVTYGLGTAFSITAGAFLVAAVMWVWIPETKGRALD